MLGLDRIELDFFFFYSSRKIEHTSDERKQRRVCKASIVPWSFLSMKKKKKNAEEEEKERRI